MVHTMHLTVVSTMLHMRIIANTVQHPPIPHEIDGDIDEGFQAALFAKGQTNLFSTPLRPSMVRLVAFNRV